LIGGKGRSRRKRIDKNKKKRGNRVTIEVKVVVDITRNRKNRRNRRNKRN
jgi:hypothetical protein